MSDPEDKEMGHVGGPLPHNEFKMIDVPEMNYFSTHTDEKGVLCPQGEILVRGSNVVPGYYKNPEKTAEAIDSEGWLHSGDIGMILPNGALKIVDRRKNIFKLSQGEYVAPDKLEQVFKTARGVGDIFVYGDSLKSKLIAFVNVDPDELPLILGELGLDKNMSVQDACKNEKLNSRSLKAINDTHKNAKLKGFERISKIFLDPVNFSDNDLITTTFKLKRFNA